MSARRMMMSFELLLRYGAIYALFSLSSAKRADMITEAISPPPSAELIRFAES